LYQIIGYYLILFRYIAFQDFALVILKIQIVSTVRKTRYYVWSFF